MQVVTLQYSQPALENPGEAKERWKPCKSKGCCSHCSPCCLVNWESLWAAEGSHVSRCAVPASEGRALWKQHHTNTFHGNSIMKSPSLAGPSSHKSMFLAEYIPAGTPPGEDDLPHDMAAWHLLQKRQDWSHSGLSWTLWTPETAAKDKSEFIQILSS